MIPKENYLENQAQSLCIIKNLNGPVLIEEINSIYNCIRNNFLPNLANSNNQNYYGYGDGGTTIEALGLMYEITFEIRFLDLMMIFTEGLVASRQQTFVPWANTTYNCWPSGSSNQVTTEQGDVIGHLSYCSKLILQSPIIWNHSYTYCQNSISTYYERAIDYLQIANETTIEYIIPNWINSLDRFMFRDGNYYGRHFSNSPVPWNQQMMLNNGFQRLIECYELLNINHKIIEKYDLYVKTSIDWFMFSQKIFVLNNSTVYVWTYSNDTNVIENTSHGNYDIWGIIRAYLSERYSLSTHSMYGFSDTFTEMMTYSINPTIRFKTNVYQLDNNSLMSWMYSSWIYLGLFDKSIYYNIANANIRSGGRQKNSPIQTANILWLKNSFYYNKTNLFHGLNISTKVSTNVSTVSPTIYPTFLQLKSNTPTIIPSKIIDLTQNPTQNLSYQQIKSNIPTTKPSFLVNPTQNPTFQQKNSDIPTTKPSKTIYMTQYPSLLQTKKKPPKMSPSMFDQTQYPSFQPSSSNSNQSQLNLRIIVIATICFGSLMLVSICIFVLIHKTKRIKRQMKLQDTT